MKRNPKQDGLPLYDCIPQSGPCPNNCSQCYYNHNFYLPIDKPHFPTLEEVGDGIVRVNSGNDSNFEREWVILSTERYLKRFFNTSIPEFDFPDPVVFTANPNEECAVPDHCIPEEQIKNLMFVRLRVSSTNLHLVQKAVKEWGGRGVPIVLTFMRYFEEAASNKQYGDQYVYREHIKNSYWCPTEEFMRVALAYVQIANAHVEMCGTPRSSLCKDCLCCAKYYYEAKRRMSSADQKNQ